MRGLLKRILGAALALGVGLFVLQIVASESGEVVVLRTFAGGQAHETRVWIVDDRGVSWLRAGRPESAWYQRVRENPDIQVERGSELLEYHAFQVEGGPTVDRINALMAEKYG